VSSKIGRTIEMTYRDLQAVIPTLNAYQIDQLSAQVIKYLKLNEALKDTYPTVCPVCGKADGQFIKKGVQARKQRYQCKDCGRKFTYDAKQITANSHQTVQSLK
jgi:transposase-like protein